MHYAKRRIESLVQERAEDKFIIFLKYMIDRSSKPTTQKDIVELIHTMTQKEIADALGISRETVSSLFSHFSKEGILLKQKGGLCVNIAKFKDL
jgi:CRP-like cAMP-binding protein